MTVFTDEYRIRADTTQAQRATRAFEQATERTFISANLKAQAYGKAIGFVAGAIRGAIGEFKKGIESAALYEKTNIALERVAGSYSIILNEQSAALESVVNISDEVIRGMQTTAIAMGAAKEEATDYVKAAVAMANATGRDANAAFQQLTKTLGGYAGELGEVIPEIKELTKEQLRSGGAVDLINEKFGDFMDLNSQGLSGQIATMSTQWDNFTEAIVKASTKWTVFNGVMSDFSKTLGEVAQIIEGRGVWEAWYAWVTLGDTEANAKAAQSELRKRQIAEVEAAGTGGALEGGGFFSIGAPEIQGKSKTARGKRKKAAKKAAEDFTVDTGEGGFLGGLPAARAYQQGLEEIEAEGQQIIEDMRNNAAELGASNLESRADRELEIKRNSSEEQLALEKEAAAASEMIREKSFGKIMSITSSFAQSAAQALVSTIEGDEIAFKKMIKNFLKAQGSMLVGQGTRDVFTGVSRGLGSYGWDATASALVALGGAEIGAGATMIGGSLAIATPGDSNASGGGGGGLGAGGSGVGGGGNAASAPGGERVINIYGAMTTAAQIELIRRGEEEAGRAGML